MKHPFSYILPILLLLPLIPLHSRMAVSPDSALYTHFVYMAGHANIIHWLINGWTLFVLHNLYTVSRLIVAYILSVALSFVYYPDRPALGASVIVAFFTGFMLIWLYQRRRLVFWQLMILIVVGFFIPHVAAMYHLVMMAAGLIYNRLEWLAADYRYFTKR